MSKSFFNLTTHVTQVENWRMRTSVLEFILLERFPLGARVMGWATLFYCGIP